MERDLSTRFILSPFGFAHGKLRRWARDHGSSPSPGVSFDKLGRAVRMTGIPLPQRLAPDNECWSNH